MLRYLRTFLPWIAFAVISTPGDSRYGAIAAFLLAVVLLLMERRRDRPWDALVIEGSSVLFFGGLSAAAYLLTPAPFGDYGTVASAVWLTLTAWGSLAVRRPFTLGIARTMVPPEVHDHPRFYRVNAVITAVWASAFTLEAAVLALLIARTPHAAVAIIAVKVGCLVLPAAFTAYYPKHVSARVAAAQRP
ncbi:MAG: hypothetical protein WCA46_26480 [Actinocatenispora sp.]